MKDVKQYMGTAGCGFFSAVEWGDQSVMLAKSPRAEVLVAKLLACLEVYPEGARGYIADANTGKIVQEHRKATLL
jgi:hypothetical protein